MNLTVEPSDLSDVLKALDKQVVQTDDPIMKENNFVWLISGAKGTGKSSLLLNMMKSHLRKTYNNIFLISPTAKRDKKFKKLVDELEEDNKYYDALTENNLNEIMDRINTYNDSKDKPKNLLILDDVIAEMKSSNSKSLLNKIITTCRHMKTSVVILTQKMNKIPTIIRSNADIMSIFRSGNKKEIKSIKEELPINEDLFDVVYDFATTVNEEQSNPFLHIVLSGAEVKFYRCFDRIHIS
jgi:DNA replication protein DnaC